MLTTESGQQTLDHLEATQRALSVERLMFGFVASELALHLGQNNAHVVAASWRAL